MKKLFIMLISAIAVLAVACSCKDNSAERVTNVFRSEEIGLPDGFTILNIAAYDNGFAVSAESDRESKLFRFDLDSKLISEQPLESDGSVIAAFPDGRIVSAGGNFIEMLSPDGKLTTAALADIFPGSYGLISIACADGNILLATQSSAAVVDEELDFVFALPVSRVQSANSVGGRLVIKITDQATFKTSVSYVDTASENFGESLDVVGEILNSPSGLFTKRASGIFDSNGAVCDFINSDIIGDKADIIAVIDSDNLLMCYDGKLLRLSRVPDSEVVPKTIIRAAGSYISADFRESAVDFNLKDPTYRIVIDDYSIYNTANDNYAGVEKLKNDIISGYRPDIMFFSSLNLNNRYHDEYIDKQLFADLNDLIDSDPEIDRSDIPVGYLKAGETDGKLFELPLTITAETFAVKGYEGDKWTLREFLDYAETGDPVLNSSSRGDPVITLYLMLACSMEEFIDADKNVKFDSELFSDALEYAAASSKQKLKDGTSKMTTAYPSSLCLTKVALGDDVKFVGLPDSDGNGTRIFPGDSIAIIKGSKVADASWRFIKSLLGDWLSKNSLRENILNSIAGNYNLFSLDGKSMTSITKTDGSEPNYDKTMFVLRDPSPEVDEYLELLDGAGNTLDYESELFSIISEDAEMYFAGAKSLDETVKIIQNRVETYISERN